MSANRILRHGPGEFILVTAFSAGLTVCSSRSHILCNLS